MGKTSRGHGFFAYILRLGDGSLYVGHTHDLGSRMRQHRRGVGSRFVRGRKFKSLEYFETYATRAEAMARERELKRKSREYKEKLIGKSLFAYGTLKYLAKQKELLGRTVSAVDAILRGYARVLKPAEFFGYADEKDKYYVAVKRRGSIVRGRLLMGLSDEDLAKTDEWEDTPNKVYARKIVAVDTPYYKKKVFAYVV
jgi:putative endonuclease